MGINGPVIPGGNRTQNYAAFTKIMNLAVSIASAGWHIKSKAYYSPQSGGHTF